MFSRKKLVRGDVSVNRGIHAGSMADIAFLLLIFFLISTTILMDQGITVRLPPWEPDRPVNHPPPKNILAIRVNAEGQLLVRGERLPVKELKAKLMQFISNPQRRPDLPSKPSKAVVSLQNDRGTSYGSYINVYNELKAAYHQLWKEEAQRLYQRDYTELGAAQQGVVRQLIPLVISEAEPTDYGAGE